MLFPDYQLMLIRINQFKPSLDIRQANSTLDRIIGAIGLRNAIDSLKFETIFPNPNQ